MYSYPNWIPFSNSIAYSVASEYSGGNITPMSTYDHDGEHFDRLTLLSTTAIQNRYKGDSDGI